METWLQSSIQALLAALALPKIGLPAIFAISLVSATLLPLGSEPAVFAYVQIAPQEFWPAVLVATLGNTIGGTITYAMGAGAGAILQSWRTKHPRPHPTTSQGTVVTAVATPANVRAGGRWHTLSTRWFRRFGPPALLVSWLPIVGDPLCAVAGWLKLPFWPCVTYMAIGKFLRYVTMTIALMHAWTWLSPWL